MQNASEFIKDLTAYLEKLETEHIQKLAQTAGMNAGNDCVCRGSIQTIQEIKAWTSNKVRLNNSPLGEYPTDNHQYQSPYHYNPEE